MNSIDFKEFFIVHWQAGLSFALIGVFLLWRHQVRRRTLRQRDDGWYVWIEWHGGERCSRDHPAEPGGAWDDSGDADGGDGGD